MSNFGYGHAVYLTRDFADGEPVLLALGDTVYKSSTEKSCAEQILSYYDIVNEPVVSLHEISSGDFKYYAVASGTLDENLKNSMSISNIVEKPDVDYAITNLSMCGKFFGTFGMSVINDVVYETLGENIDSNIINNGEFGFTEAIAAMLKKSTIKGFIVDGKQYDLGNVKSYLDSVINFSSYAEESVLNSMPSSGENNIMTECRYAGNNFCECINNNVEATQLGQMDGVPKKIVAKSVEMDGNAIKLDSMHDF